MMQKMRTQMLFRVIHFGLNECFTSQLPNFGQLFIGAKLFSTFFSLACGQMEANFADGVTYGFVANVAVYKCFLS